jgi:hypothetical protein
VTKARDEACDALDTWIWGHNGFRSVSEKQEALALVDELRKVGGK